jgi:hypothetical protein
MKLKVNRKLSSGKYLVDFTAADFTPDEISKMESFGVPSIDIQFLNSGGARAAARIGITALSPQYKASFNVEEEANAYQEKVVNQVREVMKALRERKDNFSSNQEVDV